jgi:hypothetical protein
MYDPLGGVANSVSLTLYTDSFVIKGTLRTRQARITDVLNHADEPFLVLADVVVDEYGSRNMASRSEFAQVNLDAVLFAVADTTVEPRPDLRTMKVSEEALISIPPFRVIGKIHVLPERGLGEALSELTGKYIPVTDAAFWSDTVGEARQVAPMVAINRHRAQILAPHREVDPWAGLDRSAGAGAGIADAGAGAGAGATGGADASRGPGASASQASASTSYGAPAAESRSDPAWPEADRPPGT